MTVTVLRPGLHTTVQDLGRFDYRGVGVPVSGALDAFAMRVANLLAGGAEGCAVLEATMAGPALRFEQSALIALCGGELDARVDGAPVPYWRPVLVRRGSVLELGYARSGCRAYIAVAGGFAVPAVMGSASTYVRGGFGGFAGRALQAGDTLARGEPGPAGRALAERLAAAAPGAAAAWPPWFVQPELLPAYGQGVTVRAIPGPELDRFDPAARDRFWSEPYRVTVRSDRMGCRLEGAELQLRQPLEMVSEAVAPGTVQVPPGGQPIVLLADCQTTGGYPRIAHVAAVDLPLLAQLKPGDTVRFRPVTVEEAEELLWIRSRELQLLAAGIAARIKSV
ncbi:biotin-dependent carboxyltransferase family protein [Paenibacillus hamazuiensis]|uniref:5-oxoprolinase subunit C family protein n=1 Tax=Paenibacillus hamazuiensis TaxID=2936508 RepID=UPI00200C7ABF|nr:biotin-dependent carboxyltransferase family protein [Paenibacillus hamazuiensis]